MNLTDRLQLEQEKLVEVSKQALMAREQTREIEHAQQRQLGKVELLRQLVEESRVTAEHKTESDG